MGHSYFECDKPIIHNVEGKLPYDAVKLRVADPKKKKLQSFSEAAAKTFGSASSSKSKQSRGSASQSNDRHPGGSGRVEEPVDVEKEEITSPLKPSDVAGQN
jgi:hypothetical protein